MELQSLEDSQALAQTLAPCLKPSMALLLEGDLGAGKTTFLGFICRALGWDAAKSPSFSLVNEYQARIPVAHADLYRLPQVDPRDLGLEDYLDDGWLLFLEWPDRLSRQDFENLWCCSFTVLGPQRRELRLKAQGSLALAALSELEEHLP